MTLQTKKRNLSEKISFTKNETTRIEVPQDNLIRRLSLLVTVGLVTTTTAGTGIKEDGYLNLLRKVRLTMGGDENKINVDGVKLAFVEEIQKGTAPSIDSVVVPATSSSNTKQLLLTLDFAQFRQQLLDFSALLDAPNLSSLDLEIDWGDISNILSTPNDTTVDASTTNVAVSMVEVFDDEGKALPSGFLDIRQGVDEFLVSKANTSFDDSIQEEDITPTRSNIRAHMLLTRLDTLARSDAVLTQLKVENIKGSGEKIVQEQFEEARRTNKTEFGLESIKTGVLYEDWLDRRAGGLANFEADALKWRFLTNAPAATKQNIIEVYKEYTV